MRERATNPFRQLADWEPRGNTRWIVGALTIGIGFVAHMARRPGVLSNAALFAEDGPIFFLGNRRHGIAAINDAYAGYLVMGHRSGAFIASLLPLGWTPSVYAVLAGLFATASCGLVLNGRARWAFGGWLQRTLVFVALLMLPQIAETHATLSNITWWGGIGLLLVGVADVPETNFGRVLELAFVAGVLLSGPIGIVLSPIVAWRWWRTRESWNVILGAMWAGLCVVQVVILRGQNRAVGKVAWGSDLAGVAVRRWFGPFTVGARYVQDHLAGPSWSRAAWLATLLFVAVLLVVVARARDRGAGIVLLGLGLLQIVAGFVAMGPLAHLLPDRYGVGALAGVILAVAAARPTSWPVRALHLLLIVSALIVWPRNIAVPRRDAPPFSRAAACIELQRPSCRISVYPEPFSFDLTR